MSLNIYESSGGQGPISKDASFTNPFLFSMSQDGGILEQRFYLRSDDPYNESFTDCRIFAIDSAIPDESFWVEFAPDENGGAGIYASEYNFVVPLTQELPFWLKLDVPGGQEQQIKVDVKVQVTYVQVDA